MRAAIYARVSSQRQREAHTIENQLPLLRRYVEAQGWTLSGTYVDDGRSAKAGKLEARDGFARLVRDAEAGAFDVLVVVDVDRLTRTDDMRERAEILGPFQRAGIQIVTPTGGALDLRTMLGELYVTLQAIVAAEENRKRAQRVKAGKLRAIAEGRKPAGPTPYGLSYSRATGTWSIDAAAAAIVREIYARVVAGESCMVIADDLHARAVRPPRGQWTRHTVWQLVRARHPVGTWIADKRQRLTVTVPAILDDATWSAAQAKLIEHGKRGLRKTKHVYLLEGLAVCSACGSPILIRSATSNSRRTNGNPSPAAYVCRARKLARRSETRCTAPILPVADVDGRVWAKVCEVLRGGELAAELQRRSSARAANRTSWEADARDYRARIARLAKVEEGVLARFRKGTISEAALDAELAAIARERAAVGAQLAAAEQASKTSDDEIGDVGAFVAGLRKLARNATPAARQRIVRAIVPRGAAVFAGPCVELELEVAPAPAAVPVVSVVGSG